MDSLRRAIVISEFEEVPPVSADGYLPSPPRGGQQPSTAARRKQQQQQQQQCPTSSSSYPLVSRVACVSVELRGGHLGDLECGKLVQCLDETLNLGGPPDGRLFFISVDISENEIRCPGISAIVNWFKTNRLQVRLRNLKAFKNAIADDGAFALSELISTQLSCLEELHLSHNQITGEGALALFTAFAACRTPTGLWVYPRRDVYKATPLPVWVRLEYNRISHPVKVLDRWEAETRATRNVTAPLVCFAERPHFSPRGGPHCTPVRCAHACHGNSALLHLYSYHHQTTAPVLKSASATALPPHVIPQLQRRSNKSSSQPSRIIRKNEDDVMTAAAAALLLTNNKSSGSSGTSSSTAATGGAPPIPPSTGGVIPTPSGPIPTGGGLPGGGLPPPGGIPSKAPPPPPPKSSQRANDGLPLYLILDADAFIAMRSRLTTTAGRTPTTTSCLPFSFESLLRLRTLDMIVCGAQNPDDKTTPTLTSEGSPLIVLVLNSLEEQVLRLTHHNPLLREEVIYTNRHYVSGLLSSGLLEPVEDQSKQQQCRPRLMLPHEGCAKAASMGVSVESLNVLDFAAVWGHHLRRVRRAASSSSYQGSTTPFTLLVTGNTALLQFFSLLCADQRWALGNTTNSTTISGNLACVHVDQLNAIFSTSFPEIGAALRGDRQTGGYKLNAERVREAIMVSAAKGDIIVDSLDTELAPLQRQPTTQQQQPLPRLSSADQSALQAWLNTNRTQDSCWSLSADLPQWQQQPSEDSLALLQRENAQLRFQLRRAMRLVGGLCHQLGGEDKAAAVLLQAAASPESRSADSLLDALGGAESLFS